jgi:hypothetical protein
MEVPGMKQGLLNDQYNFAAPDSFSMQIALRIRRRMFTMFMEQFQPAEFETVLDVGVTSDQSYENSNYFEALYPYKNRIVAIGLQDADFLQIQYPGLHYIRANALNMPFRDRAFDLVHSSAVLEHVGAPERQSRMIAECLRIARRGICVTTPNRWFPIEVHSQLPLVHWLPKSFCRKIFRGLGFEALADESNLNLVDARQLRSLAGPTTEWHFRIGATRVFGWRSNLILFGYKMDGLSDANSGGAKWTGV